MISRKRREIFCKITCDLIGCYVTKVFMCRHHRYGNSVQLNIMLSLFEDEVNSFVVPVSSSYLRNLCIN